MLGERISLKINKNQIQTHGIDLSDFTEEHITSMEEVFDLYKKMALIRKMETKLEKFYGEGKIRGFCHLLIGQEGIYGALWRVIEEDKLISSYRCHGAAYASGCSIREIVAENLGLKSGNCKGKGGSMHLYNDKFYGGHGIVGAQVPLGLGIAYALKYKKYLHEGSKGNFKDLVSDGVCFILYGDGASNQGQVYESFNMAKIYNLPVVFICENNTYGMYTPVEAVSVDDCFYKRGYGIPGLRTNDSDVFLLIEVLKCAKNFSKEHGPIIVQIDTNRKCGHSALDKDQSYRRTSDSHDDGLDCLEKKLETMCAKDIFQKVKNEVNEEFNNELNAINYNSFPDPSDIYTDLIK